MGSLGPIWIFFSSLITQFSSLITHHLKYPNFLIPTRLAIVFNSHHSIISTVLWDPHTNPKKTFLSFFSPLTLTSFFDYPFFFPPRLSLEHLRDWEVKLMKSTWGSWTLWAIYREMLPRALPKKQQSIPMPFYSPQKFSMCNVNWTLWSNSKK